MNSDNEEEEQQQNRTNGLIDSVMKLGTA